GSGHEGTGHDAVLHRWGQVGWGDPLIIPNHPPAGQAMVRLAARICERGQNSLRARKCERLNARRFKLECEFEEKNWRRRFPSVSLLLTLLRRDQRLSPGAWVPQVKTGWCPVTRTIDYAGGLSKNGMRRLTTGIAASARGPARTPDRWPRRPLRRRKP